jgi:hypothetical protein
MDDLIEALRFGNTYVIAMLARQVLLRDDFTLNRVAVSYFERYAPCKVTKQEGDAFHRPSYIAQIKYGNSIYTF